MSDLKPEVFDRAIELLNKNGWCQYEGQNYLGKICAGQAIAQSVKDMKFPVRIDFRDTTPYLYFAASLVTSEFLHEWNDEPNRAKEDVVKLFEGCAERLRSGL